MPVARFLRRSLGAAAAGATLTIIALTAHAGDAAEKMLPVDPLGKQWWQLYASIPNPIKERLGEGRDACALGQNGSLWFLSTAGNGSTPVTRRCTVPRGTRIFLPIVTAICVPFGEETPAENVQLCRELIDPFDKLVLRIDGKDRGNLIERRAQSQTFPVYFPEQNIFDSPEEDVPAGVYSAVTEGYYALIDGLPPGHHTIFGRAVSTTNPDVPTFQFTWQIDVVAPKNVTPR